MNSALTSCKFVSAPNYPLITSMINFSNHIAAYCVVFLCKLFYEERIEAIKKALCRRKYLFESDLVVVLKMQTNN